MNNSIRAQYERFGARNYYERCGATYRNPHEPVIRRVLGEAVLTWRLDVHDVLDLACGSGEATLALRDLGAERITGIDAYTASAFQERTGQLAESMTFDQIAAGSLAGRRYSLIVCSFALHLVEPSRLPRLAMQLSTVGNALLILSPHKRPIIKPEWGWHLDGELVRERVRARCYRPMTEPAR